MSESCQTNEPKLPFSERIKTWSFWKPYLFVAIGGLSGYLYYYFVGCASGSCGITSNPYASTAVGGFFGYFILNRPCSTC
jgi:hypothetical protein